MEFLTLLAAKRGHLRKGGAADHDAAARAVLQDWNVGNIKYHTEPPAPTSAVEIVPHFAQEFDWSAAPRTELPEDAPPAASAATAAADDSAEGMEQSTGGLLDSWTKTQGRGGAAPAGKQGKVGKPSAQRLGGEHDPYNFQPNKAIRKQQQASKKKARRVAASAMSM
uniref:Uncharacterized protein n=1 Tax=Haptolina ericina TaxID=156174 RepID=A0A7S3AHC0_9EUKA|mmetsp:Transcript_15056/g.33682  ORF Transcript_15056/g.33682 Transcript_15056/m.33682 type:complete len:167 (+) Transcript_15056:2-502(+)